MEKLRMMSVNGENKNMENKNKRTPRKYLRPVPDDETREVTLWLLQDILRRTRRYRKN